MSSQPYSFIFNIFFLEKVRSIKTLLKFRLSSLVVFSSLFGYVLGSNGVIDWFTLFMLSVGGFLISGASVAFNQIMEKDYDAMMERTKSRPIPMGILDVNEAVFVAIFSLVLGSVLIALYCNLLTLFLSLFSFILYSFIYTPLKRVGAIAVFVGAIPGALPPLIGWVAANNSIGYEALIIFGIQFIWQFPHFWAIAWLSDEDYKKAGYKLLPGNGTKDLKTAINIVIYTLFLLPLGLLPMYFRITGINSAFIVTICGVLFLAQTFNLLKDPSRKSAFRTMMASFIYLPVVQISFMLDIL